MEILLRILMVHQVMIIKYGEMEGLRAQGCVTRNLENQRSRSKLGLTWSSRYERSYKTFLRDKQAR